MFKRSPKREFSMRYCPSLRDGVVLIQDSHMKTQNQTLCLSSHLCGADVRMRCAYAETPLREIDTLYVCAKQQF